MNTNFDLSEIERTREQVLLALAGAPNDETRNALHASLQILNKLADVPQSDRLSRYAGSIDYTFEDEQYEPFGRQIDVRISYSWYDYDSADEPSPVWGASIEDLEVLVVRHFDKDGNEVELGVHYLDVAWDLLNKNHEQVTEACTEDGYHNGVGHAPITYAPMRSSSKIAAPGATSFATRLAPSLPTRTPQQDRRQLG